MADDTRDIAVQASTKIDAHVSDCMQFRTALRGDLKEFRDDLRKLNQRMATLLGALIILSKGIDWVIKVMGHS